MMDQEIMKIFLRLIEEGASEEELYSRICGYLDGITRAAAEEEIRRIAHGL